MGWRVVRTRRRIHGTWRIGGAGYGRLRLAMLRSTLLHDVPHAFTGVDDGDFRDLGSWGGGGSPLRNASPAVAASARLVRHLGATGPLVGAVQVHGATVVREDARAPGLEADALVSTTPGTAVAVRVADCVPVLMAAPGGVAAVHAGWRGTAAGIVAASLEALCAATGVGAARVRAVVGPSVCGRCYTVGDEVVAGVRAAVDGASSDSAWLARDGGVPRVDLKAANAAVLRARGVQVEVLSACTICSPGYWSHRRDGAAAGRQVGAIALR
jgi:YfiH family protein